MMQLYHGSTQVVKMGKFDNVSTCKYSVPDYWDIGDVFSRLVEDCFSKQGYVEKGKSLSTITREAICAKMKIRIILI